MTNNEIEVPWGPTGEVVYKRTYSRTKPDGTKETWPETAERVATGNLALVYGAPDTWSKEVWEEFAELCHYITTFRIIPAGRHLWATGVKGRQYLFNCHVAGFEQKLSRHFEFTFMRLMEGGGVGANYSTEYLRQFGKPRNDVEVHIVCDPMHPDYEDMLSAGLLSDGYDADWAGSFEVEDSREGWAAAQTDLIDTAMSTEPVKHKERVYDVSRVRGKGARLKTFGGTASGPLPFARMMIETGKVLSEAAHSAHDFLTPLQAMEIDHETGRCVVSGGNRRSARMSILPWDDDFIFEFLACKTDPSKHWTTNVSVAIDNEFTTLLSLSEADADRMDAPVWDHWLLAQAVHARVVEGMLTNGEPGYWNKELSNAGEPTPVIATNPCGEIALESAEPCVLGHVNLDAFAPKTKGTKRDILGLVTAHRLMTRFLIRATYGDMNDPMQRDVLARNRRIGVGHLGTQSFWAKLGVRYSDVPNHRPAQAFLLDMGDVVDKAAQSYAFTLRIPVPVKTRTVAPTGSIAKLPGVSEGIHPIYARFFERRVRFSLNDPDQANTVLEARASGLTVEVDMMDPSESTAIIVYPTKEKLMDEVTALGLDPREVVQSAEQISVEDMLSFQQMYQVYWADNAVSFTVNVPAEKHQQDSMVNDPSAPVPPPSKERMDEVSKTLIRFLPTLKGTTLMVDGSRPQAPYTRITEAQYESALVKSVADSTDEDCASGACPIR